MSTTATTATDADDAEELVETTTTTTTTTVVVVATQKRGHEDGVDGACDKEEDSDDPHNHSVSTTTSSAVASAQEESAEAGDDTTKADKTSLITTTTTTTTTTTVQRTITNRTAENDQEEDEEERCGVNEKEGDPTRRRTKQVSGEAHPARPSRKAKKNSNSKGPQSSAAAATAAAPPRPPFTTRSPISTHNGVFTYDAVADAHCSAINFAKLNPLTHSPHRRRNQQQHQQERQTRPGTTPASTKESSASILETARLKPSARSQQQQPTHQGLLLEGSLTYGTRSPMRGAPPLSHDFLLLAANHRGRSSTSSSARVGSSSSGGGGRSLEVPSVASETYNRRSSFLELPDVMKRPNDALRAQLPREHHGFLPIRQGTEDNKMSRTMSPMAASATFKRWFPNKPMSSCGSNPPTPPPPTTAPVAAAAAAAAPCSSSSPSSPHGDAAAIVVLRSSSNRHSEATNASPKTRNHNSAVDEKKSHASNSASQPTSPSTTKQQREESADRASDTSSFEDEDKESEKGSSASSRSASSSTLTNSRTTSPHHHHHHQVPTSTAKPSFSVTANTATSSQPPRTHEVSKDNHSQQRGHEEKGAAARNGDDEKADEEPLRLTVLTETHIAILLRSEDYNRRQLTASQAAHIERKLLQPFYQKLLILSEHQKQRRAVSYVEEDHRISLEDLHRSETNKLIHAMKRDRRGAKACEEKTADCPLLGVNESFLLDQAALTYVERPAGGGGGYSNEDAARQQQQQQHKDSLTSTGALVVEGSGAATSSSSPAVAVSASGDVSTQALTPPPPASLMSTPSLVLPVMNGTRPSHHSRGGGNIGSGAITVNPAATGSLLVELRYSISQGYTDPLTLSVLVFDKENRNIASLTTGESYRCPVTNEVVLRSWGAYNFRKPIPLGDKRRASLASTTLSTDAALIASKPGGGASAGGAAAVGVAAMFLAASVARGNQRRTSRVHIEAADSAAAAAAAASPPLTADHGTTPSKQLIPKKPTSAGSSNSSRGGGGVMAAEHRRSRNGSMWSMTSLSHAAESPSPAKPPHSTSSSSTPRKSVAFGSSGRRSTIGSTLQGAGGSTSSGIHKGVHPQSQQMTVTEIAQLVRENLTGPLSDQDLLAVGGEEAMLLLDGTAGQDGSGGIGSGRKKSLSAVSGGRSSSTLRAAALRRASLAAVSGGKRGSSANSSASSMGSTPSSSPPQTDLSPYGIMKPEALLLLQKDSNSAASATTQRDTPSEFYQTFELIISALQCERSPVHRFAFVISNGKKSGGSLLSLYRGYLTVRRVLTEEDMEDGSRSNSSGKGDKQQPAQNNNKKVSTERRAWNVVSMRLPDRPSDITSLVVASLCRSQLSSHHHHHRHQHPPVSPSMMGASSTTALFPSGGGAGAGGGKSPKRPVSATNSDQSQPPLAQPTHALIMDQSTTVSPSASMTTFPQQQQQQLLAASHRRGVPSSSSGPPPSVSFQTLLQCHFFSDPSVVNVYRLPAAISQSFLFLSPGECYDRAVLSASKRWMRQLDELTERAGRVYVYCREVQQRAQLLETFAHLMNFFHSSSTIRSSSVQFGGGGGGLLRAPSQTRFAGAVDEEGALSSTASSFSAAVFPSLQVGGGGAAPPRRSPSTAALSFRATSGVYSQQQQPSFYGNFESPGNSGNDVPFGSGGSHATTTTTSVPLLLSSGAGGAAGATTPSMAALDYPDRMLMMYHYSSPSGGGGGLSNQQFLLSPQPSSLATLTGSPSTATLALNQNSTTSLALSPAAAQHPLSVTSPAASSLDQLQQQQQNSRAVSLALRAAAAQLTAQVLITSAPMLVARQIKVVQQAADAECWDAMRHVMAGRYGL